MYYIYHVEGIKIGCSKDPNYRVKDQGYSNYEILEKHEDVYTASNREMALQKEYGYPVDTVPYFKTILAATKESRRKGGLVSGNIHGKKLYEQGKGLFAMSEEAKLQARSKAGIVGGKRNKDSGQMSALGKSGIGGKIGGKITGKKNVESGHWNNLISRITTCPHCGKSIKGGNYFRHHGDRCKAKPQ